MMTIPIQELILDTQKAILVWRRTQTRIEDNYVLEFSEYKITAKKMFLEGGKILYKITTSENISVPDASSFQVHKLIEAIEAELKHTFEQEEKYLNRWIQKFGECCEIEKSIARTKEDITSERCKWTFSFGTGTFNNAAYVLKKCSEVNKLGTKAPVYGLIYRDNLVKSNGEEDGIGIYICVLPNQNCTFDWCVEPPLLVSESDRIAKIKLIEFVEKRGN